MVGFGRHPRSLALNVLLFLFAFRILTVADISWSDAALGALVGAVAWTTLEAVGGYYVGHQLRSASEVYGTFATVIGLLAWIYLGAQVTLYAAEINVVRKDHLWPRSLLQPPPDASGPAGPQEGHCCIGSGGAASARLRS